MTLTPLQLGVYALGMAGLWSVPGPVWVAILARSISGGFAAAWPLAVGVTIGDCLWPALAIFGMGWVLSVWGDALHILRLVAAVIFVVMGILLIRKSGSLGKPDSRLTKPGRLAGFMTGVAAVIGNPKAILFYMSVLPGFFGDLSKLTAPDILSVIVLSMLVPLIGNLMLAAFLSRVRGLLASAHRVQLLNRISGVLLILVGCVVPFV